MLTISKGNKKLGKTPNFSLVAGDTCPMKSKVCENICYAMKGFIVLQRAKYQANYDATLTDTFVDDMVQRIRQETQKMRYPSFRFQVSGDIYSIEYAHKIKQIAQQLPDVHFWAYTRSWASSAMLPALEEIRALPNFELFASIDESMPAPPTDWRVAYMESDNRNSGLVCPEQTGTKASCADCHYCFMGSRGNVVFKIH